MKKLMSSNEVLIVLLLVFTGCVNYSLHRKGDINRDIELSLIPLGNVDDLKSWPPSVFIERNDGAGITLNDRLPKLKYVPGSAILLVKNLGNQAQKIEPWFDQMWKVVIEEGDTCQEFQLLGYENTLPSFGAPPKLVLMPRETVAIIVGLGCFLPCEGHGKKSQKKISNMYVIYGNKEQSIKSNLFKIYRYATE
jgi:hypothetical protein